MTFVGFTAVVMRSSRLADISTDAVEDAAIQDVPDCQCLGICNTPDTGHDGTWCYINSEISPCTDSTKRVVYGQSWARCEVIYGDDDCSGNPCKNSAICVDKYDGYECVCRAGWSGTEGDSSGSEELAFRGIGRSVRGDDDDCPSDNDDNPGYKEYTMVAKDVGELHKVTYKVADDDSLDPAVIQVEFKGEVYVAVGDLPKSEYAKAVSVTMVKGREYSLTFGTADAPNWAATSNDIYVQLTGSDWQVSGAVVAFPTGMDDGVNCETTFYAADVGDPAKVTYWVRNDDSVLPSEIVVDDRWAAEVTTGEQCYGQDFVGDDDNGDGFAFEDASCSAGDGEGCTDTDGCRWCSLWDPSTADNEVLCPWVLPYSDGRYIIIDLVDQWDSTTAAPGSNGTNA